MVDDAAGRRAVALVTGEYPPARGGVGDYTARLGEALERRGWAVTVVTRQLAAPSAEEGDVRRVDGWGVALGRAVQDLRRSGWRGVVHLQYQAGAFDLAGRIAALPLLARPFPVVTTFHDLRVPYLFPKAGPLRPWVLHWLARASAAVVVTNVEDERVVRRWGGAPERLWRIPIGSNLPPPRDPLATRRSLGLPMDEPIVVFFGFRQPEKGLDTLVAAVARLAEPRPLLVLLGGERPDALGAQGARPTGLVRAPGVPLVDLGYRPAQEVADLLAAADVVALPFRSGASLRHGTLVAALACGAVVVTTRPTDPSTLLPLRDGESCRLVPPGTPDALASMLATLLADPEQRSRLRRGARAVADAFSWERIAERHAQLYQVLLSKVTPTSG